MFFKLNVMTAECTEAYIKKIILVGSFKANYIQIEQDLNSSSSMSHIVLGNFSIFAFLDYLF